MVDRLSKNYSFRTFYRSRRSRISYRTYYSPRLQTYGPALAQNKKIKIYFLFLKINFYFFKKKFKKKQSQKPRPENAPPRKAASRPKIILGHLAVLAKTAKNTPPRARSAERFATPAKLGGVGGG